MARPLRPFMRQLLSWGGLGLAVMTAIALGLGVLLVGRVGIRPILGAAGWFDPLFFQYNVLLLAFVQTLVPLVTLMYVLRMRHEKERRLRRDLPDALWRANEAEILGRLDAHFRWGNYFGSVALIMTIITFGAAIILLCKPLFTPPGPNETRSGIDYLKGANFLMLGPFIDQAPGSEVFTRRLVTSLTAFQFGFLGGFVYFIGHLVRSYFTLDLTPHTYVESGVRMSAASLLALVISFAVPLPVPCTETSGCVFSAVPMVAFFFGYFPTRALLFIEKAASKLIGSSVETYASTPLSELPGMSLAHEVRLNREGFDNVENLSQADTLELAIRTGFGYRQLRQWVGEAWLRRHLGADYAAFVTATGITTRHEFGEVVTSLMAEAGVAHPTDPVLEQLTDGPDGALKRKVHAVYYLVRGYEPHRTSRVPPV